MNYVHHLQLPPQGSYLVMSVIRLAYTSKSTTAVVTRRSDCILQLWPYLIQDITAGVRGQADWLEYSLFYGYHLWPIKRVQYFPHYLINGMTFGKKSYDFHFTLNEDILLCLNSRSKTKCLKLPSKHYNLWNISHSKQNCATYDQTCILVFI